MQIRRSGVTKFLAKNANLRGYIKAENLIGWLNVRKDHPQWRTMKRAAALIRDLREINSIAENQDVENHVESIKARGFALDAEIRKLIRPLRRLQWRLIPTLQNREGRFVGWHLELSSGDDFRRVLLQVAELSRDGLLDWVRQCQGPSCGKWLIAQKGNNVFCSDACRENAWSERRKTPEGRAARAKYMREHRGTLKKRAQKLKQ